MGVRWDIEQMTNDEIPNDEGMPKSEARTAEEKAVSPPPAKKRLTSSGRPYDLEERTGLFGEEVIGFCKRLAQTVITEPLIRQIVKSATSVGANYCEADDAVSKKEFRLKIGTCKKESRETKHWLRMIVAAQPAVRNEAAILWQEANELHLIFAAIHRRGKS
jgi:four helix bundle protein